MPHSQSAVDGQHGPGYVASTDEETDAVCDFGCLSISTSRYCGQNLGLALLVEFSGHVGLDESGSDDVDGDSARTDLTGQRSCRADESGLGCGVVHLAS